MAPCYTGPPGTQDIGVCAPGTWICDPDGMGYGPCVGEVLPSLENCATPEDEDCDTIVAPCPDPPLFAGLYGDAQLQTAFAVGVDPMDNWLIAGNVYGTIDFGSGPLVGGTEPAVYLAKLDPSGAILWAKIFGDGVSGQGTRSLAVDAQGNAVLLGRFNGTADFGGGPIIAPGPASLFVAKFDPAGGLVFANAFACGNTTIDGSMDTVAVGPAGEIVMAGSFQNTADFGGAQLVSAGSADIYVAKLDAQGNHVWSKSFGDAMAERSGGVGVDSLGNVILAGGFSGTVDFGGGVLSTAGGGTDLDVYVAKLDAQGGHVWSKRVGGVDAELGGPVAVGAGDIILFAGGAAGPIDLGGGPIEAVPADARCYAAALSPAGDHLWSAPFGCSYEQIGSSVAADPAGHTIVSGAFKNTGDFGDGPVTAVGRDAFVMKLDSSGAPLWSKVYSAPGIWDKTNEAAVDSLGNVIAVGHIEGPVDLGGGILTGQGALDAFVVKLAP